MKIATFPSRALGLSFSIPALAALGLLIVPEYGPIVLALDVSLFAIALVDLFLSRAPPIAIGRSYRDVFSVGVPNPVDVYVTFRGKRPLDVEIRADLPALAESPDLPLRTRLVPGATVVLRHHVVPRDRGDAVLGDHHLRVGSRLGLWRKQITVPAFDPIRVYPNLRTIRSFDLLSRKHRQYALVRASALRGGESEFARLRDYTPGDDQRFVDWKATARRGVLTSREFQLESDQNVVLCIDSGRLMTALVGGLSQFDHALSAALLLAHVACRGGDRVGLFCFDDEVRAFVPPEGGPHATRKLIRASYALRAELRDSAYRVALGILGQRLRRRSLLVLFTQLVDDQAASELSARLRLLSETHLPLVVVLEDTDLRHEIDRPAHELGRHALYRKGAAAELLVGKNQALAALRKSGAHVIETSIHSLSSTLVNRYLALKARRAL